MGKYHSATLQSLIESYNYLYFSGRVGFFDLSQSYSAALVSTFMFTLGFMLLLDLALGKINIFRLLTTGEAGGAGGARAGRELPLLQPLYSLLPPAEAVAREVASTVQQITEAIEKFENRNNPRAF